MASLEKNIKELQSHLDDGEIIEASIYGAYETKIIGSGTINNGILAATNKKVVFFGKKMFGFDLEVFPYSNISSVEYSKDMMGHKVTLFASGNKASMKWINKGEVQRFVEIVKSRIGKKETTQGTVSSDDDIYTQIEKLSDLKNKGIISEQEFETKKKQLLGI